MGVLIGKTIALFHCVSFDCFIELQVLHQVVWISIIYTKKNGYPSMAKQKQESYSACVGFTPCLYLLYRQDLRCYFTFLPLYISLPHCFKAPHLVGVVHCTSLPPENKQDIKISSIKSFMHIIQRYHRSVCYHHQALQRNNLYTSHFLSLVTKRKQDGVTSSKDLASPPHSLFSISSTCISLCNTLNVKT